VRDLCGSYGMTVKIAIFLDVAAWSGRRLPNVLVVTCCFKVQDTMQMEVAGFSETLVNL
jgi:hypothetical protein